MYNLDCLFQAQLKAVNFGHVDYFAVLDFYSATYESTGHSFLYLDFGMLLYICLNGSFVSQSVLQNGLIRLIGSKVTQIYKPCQHILEFNNGNTLSLPTPFQFQPNIWIRE
jgi:hypothetical protein